MFYYTESTVSPNFRETVLSHFPNLASKKNAYLLRLLDYIVLGADFDKDTGNLLLSRDLVKTIKWPSASKSENFVVRDVLNEFSDKVFSLHTTPASWHGHKVRSLNLADVPDWLIELRESEFALNCSDPGVGLASGSSQPRDKVYLDRLAYVDTQYHLARDPQVESVLNYLNGLDPMLFECLKGNYEDAMKVVQLLPDPQSQANQARLLSRVARAPKPFYSPVKNSARIYCSGPSFPYLKGVVRDAFTKGWVQIDLKQSQLMIISERWGLGCIREYLDEINHGIWRDLAEKLEVDYSEELKGEFKKALYSLIFGSTRKKTLDDRLKPLTFDQKNRFLKHELVDMVVRGFSLRRKKLKTRGFLVDAFGKEMAIGKVDKKDFGHRLRSIVAAEAQSFEFAILAPVIEYAKSTQGEESPLVVTGWLHDGLWVDCDDKEALPRHIDEVRDLIKTTSFRLLGFEMEAEVDYGV